VSRYRLTVGASLIIPFLGACESAPCDQQQMLRVINKDIKADGRNTSEYQLAEIKREGNMVYVGMSQKISPLYRRHYFISPKSCQVLDVKIDQ
jgi:hypothetical protein